MYQTVALRAILPRCDGRKSKDEKVRKDEGYEEERGRRGGELKKLTFTFLLFGNYMFK